MFWEVRDLIWEVVLRDLKRRGIRAPVILPTRRWATVTASVVRQTDGALFSARLARVTLARMSDAFFVQMNGLGASLC